MASNLREKFQAIADDHRKKTDANKYLAVECTTVLERIVRPAIRTMREVFPESSTIRYSEGKEPGIQVRNQYEDELKFICTSPILEVKRKLGGISGTFEFKIENVSEELIGEQLDIFLRESLDL